MVSFPQAVVPHDEEKLCVTILRKELTNERDVRLISLVFVLTMLLTASVDAAPGGKSKGPENLLPQPACAMLDTPTVRGLMSAMFETKLLLLRGRQDELGGKAKKARTEQQIPEAVLAADVQVNNSATDIGASTTQSETTIRVNRNTGTICSAYNDSQHWAQGSIGFHGFSSSTDGGGTFVDHGPFPAGGGANGFGDPSLEWRHDDGYFYYAALHTTGLGLWRSTDDCESFAFRSMIHTGTGDDKELMTIDNNPASPYYGRIYVAWTDFSAAARIYATYSDDGLSWSAPVALSAAGVSVQGAWPAVDPVTGDVYVGWVRWNPYPTGPIDIEIVRSVNGGATWGFVTNPLTGAVNPRDAGATSSCGRPALNSDIRYLPSPQVAVDYYSNLHVVYSYDPDGYGAGDVVNVYYRRSTDQGATWGPEIQLNDDGTATDQWFPTVSVGPTDVVVATWYDRRNDVANNRWFDYYTEYSGKTYNVGGYLSGGAVEVYDPATDSWITGTPEPLPNIEYPVDACFGYNDFGDPVILLLPDTTGTVVGVWHRYNIATDSWDQPPIPAPLPSNGIWAPDIVVDRANNVCYITGGATAPGGGNLTTLYEYHPDTNTAALLGNFTHTPSGFDFNAGWLAPLIGAAGAVCVGGGVYRTSVVYADTQCYDIAAGIFNPPNADLGLLPEPWWGMADMEKDHDGDFQLWIANGADATNSMLQRSAYFSLMTGVFAYGPDPIYGVFRVEGDNQLGNIYVVDGSAVVGFSLSTLHEQLVQWEPTAPIISGLPDVIVDHTTALPVQIDLWAYASDVETPDSGLTYSIEGSPPPGAGVTIVGNRWLTIDPSTSWCVPRDVTIRVTDPDGLWDNDTFREGVTWSCKG